MRPLLCHCLCHCSIRHVITPCHFIIDTNTIHRPKTKSKQMCRFLFAATTSCVRIKTLRLFALFITYLNASFWHFLFFSFVFWCFFFLRWACPTCSDFLNLVQGIMDLQELLAKMTLKVKTMKSLPHRKLPQPNTEKLKLNMKTVGSHVSERNKIITWKDPLTFLSCRLTDK